VIVETSRGGLATSIEAEGAALTLESALDLAYKEVGDTAADQ
jgi:hypothetical protein